MRRYLYWILALGLVFYPAIVKRYPLVSVITEPRGF